MESEILNAIKEDIKTECETITLYDIADKYHFAHSYLSRAIRRNTGRTFLELKNIARLEKVKKMVQEGIPEETIAQHMDIDMMYLRDWFKKHEGVTLYRYIRRVRA